MDEETLESTIQETEVPIDEVTIPELEEGVHSVRGTSAYYEYYAPINSTRMTNYLLLAVVAMLILIFVFRSKNQ